jgi:hypothetical protein
LDGARQGALGVGLVLLDLELAVDVDTADGAGFRVLDTQIVEAEADVLGLVPGSF